MWQVKTLKEIMTRFEDMHKDFLRLSGLGPYNIIQSLWIDTETITAADVIRIVEVWTESVYLGLERLVYDDAAREFAFFHDRFWCRRNSG
jgi:hypothetical protein